MELLVSAEMVSHRGALPRGRVELDRSDGGAQRAGGREANPSVRCEAEAMDSFASSGQFWLSQTPDRRVHGDLSFDEAGIQLRLTKTLRGPVVISDRTSGGPMEWATEPVVHGRLRSGDEVTLLQASGFAMPVDIAQETWSASFALTGGLVPDDQFSRVQVTFDYLLPWVGPPGILRSELTASTVTIDTARSTLAEATLADARTVRLLTGVTAQSRLGPPGAVVCLRGRGPADTTCRDPQRLGPPTPGPPGRLPGPASPARRHSPRHWSRTAPVLRGRPGARHGPSARAS